MTFCLVLTCYIYDNIYSVKQLEQLLTNVDPEGQMG